MENDRSHYLLGNWRKKWKGVQGPVGGGERRCRIPKNERNRIKEGIWYKRGGGGKEEKDEFKKIGMIYNI